MILFKTIKTNPLPHTTKEPVTEAIEERDLEQDELSSATTYSYTTGVEQSGTKALYLTLENTEDPLTFLKK